jgi:hypothetical protein
MIKKKQRRLGFSILILTALSCNNGGGVVSKEVVETKNFSFHLPSNIKSKPEIHQNDEGDSGSIVIEELGTMWFNFGYDIDNLSEKDPPVIYYPYNDDSIRSKLDTSLVDADKIIHTKKSNFDIDEFRKQNVYYELVSGYKAKITVPRNTLKGGITGLYIDSIRNDYSGRLKFNFYTKNLDSLKQEIMLKVIRSLKLKVR